MQQSYTVLCFNFGGYDKVRQPKKIDPKARYVFVTDRPIQAGHWNVCVDNLLANTSPIYASYYVRWHPFRYASTDIVIVIDASVQLNDSLRDIYDTFVEENADFMPMCSRFNTDSDKLDFWHTKTRRLDDFDATRLQQFIDRRCPPDMRGSLGMSIAVYRNTRTVRMYQRHVWRYLQILGYKGVPNRLDEIVAHRVLAQYYDRMKLVPVSVQTIQSTYMTYCNHGNDSPIPTYKDTDDIYYLCGHPVSPVRFSKKVNYPRYYRYRTEALLLTRYLTADDLADWLDHHLYTVKFDHVHVMDNLSNYDAQEVCNRYGDLVSYQKVYGHPRQYKLYDAYIGAMSAAEWVMPIDDDEYLWLDGFDSVMDAISYYKEKFGHLMMLGVRWKHLFPKHFNEERTGSVLSYCTEENPDLARKFMHLGDTTVKCIVRRYGSIHYEETWENPDGGHVPKHGCADGATLCDGSKVRGCGIIGCPGNLDDERIRLIHCRYTGPKDWERRYGGDGETTVSDSSPRKKQFPFMELLGKLD